MKVLVLNAGSSSLKYQLIDMRDESLIAKGVCDRISLGGSFISQRAAGSDEVRYETPMPTHFEAIKEILKALVSPEFGVIKSLDEIAAVGHRVVHSGEDFTSAVLIDDRSIVRIESNYELAPLHMVPNITGMKACREVLPGVPQAAVFDTTFHATMPDYAYMYAIPYEDYRQYKIRKYGFHGTSHQFVSGEAAKLMGTDQIKTVVCHLGNGASVSAVKNGKCVDTSMGLTPLEGLIMGTRSGDIDPAVLQFLMDKTGMTIQEATDYLNKKSGVKGVSGVSSDFRDLIAAMDEGNDRARLAIEMFSYRVKKYIGSYAAAMGGLDCIAFTGGIGENTEIVRELVMKDMEYLGVDFDFKKNRNVKRGAVTALSTERSRVSVYIIPTNEELVIARETVKLKP
ncbi:MAG: acetate kinase [Clostridiales bacterium]|jgi:acetate kinase|nr:acetate kinase [Clostridiales bacterium]